MASTRSLAMAAATAAVLTLVTGCGDSSSGDGGGGSDSNTIKVLVIGQFQASSFSLPEMESGAKAAVEAINKAGGVNGKKIELESCNDQGDPNVAAQCARKAVTDHVAAVAGTITEYASNVLPVLEGAGIAYVGALPLTDADFKSSVSFPLDGGNPANFAGEGIALVKHGCKNVGIVTNADSSAGEVSGALLQSGVKSAGGSVAKQIAVPLNQPDYAPAVSTLLGAGAECIGIALPPAQSAQFVGAVRQSSKPEMLVANNVAVVPQALIDASKGAYDGALLTSSAYVPGTSDKSDQFEADYKASGAKEPADLNAQLAWSSIQAIAEIAKNIDGTVDAKSFLDQANKTTDLKVPTFSQTYDFSKPNPAPDYPRLFGPTALIYTVQDGKYKLTSPTPIDVESAIQ